MSADQKPDPSEPPPEFAIALLAEDVEELTEEVATLSRRLENEQVLAERIAALDRRLKELERTVQATGGMRDRVTQLEANPEPRWLATLIATAAAAVYGLYEAARLLVRVIRAGSGQ